MVDTFEDLVKTSAGGLGQHESMVAGREVLARKGRVGNVFDSSPSTASCRAPRLAALCAPRTDISAPPHTLALSLCVVPPVPARAGT